MAFSEKGLCLQALRQLFQACVTTISDFGAEVCSKGQRGATNTVQQIQNQTMRKIAGVFQAPPITSLKAETALLPTNIRLDLVQRKYARQLLSILNQHPIIQVYPESRPTTSDANQVEPTVKRTWESRTQSLQQCHIRRRRILATKKQWIQPE